jgi:hypothetical protein
MGNEQEWQMPIPLHRLGLGYFTAAVAMLTAATAHGSVIYTYTGHTFGETYLDGGTIPGDVYTTGDRVTIVFELAAPLGAGISDAVITPVRFALADGVNTLTGANATQVTFVLSTSVSGHISNWQIVASMDSEVGGSLVSQSIASYHRFNVGLSVGDSAWDRRCVFTPAKDDCLVGETVPSSYVQFGDVRGPGTWEVRNEPPSSVPEPSALLLIATGVLGAVVRRVVR